MLGALAGRAGETGALTFDAAKWDDEFDCMVIEVQMGKVGRAFSHTRAHISGVTWFVCSCARVFADPVCMIKETHVIIWPNLATRQPADRVQTLDGLRRLVVLLGDVLESLLPLRRASH